MAAPKNPVGHKGEKIWRDAVMRAVHRNLKGAKTKRLETLAEKLVEQALDGNMVALKEIGDRLDGKPKESVEVSAGDGWADVLQAVDGKTRPAQAINGKDHSPPERAEH